MSETETSPGAASGEPGDRLTFPEANVAAVRAVADLLRTTFGPCSRDKLLVEGDDEGDPPATGVPRMTVTDDGAALLEALPLRHPVAPVLRRLVGPERPGDTGVEGEDVADAVTTRVLLAAALLDEATSLLDRGLHPTTVAGGYRRACTVARERLADQRVVPAETRDERAHLIAAARTAITGNDVGGLADALAEIAVDAVEIVAVPDEVSLAVRRTPHGSLADARLVRGAILPRSDRAHREMPRGLADAAVLVLDGHDRGTLGDRDAPESVTAAVDSPDDAAAFDAARRERKERVVAGFVDAGADVVVARLGIDPEYQRLLADEGILGVRRVAPLPLRQVAAATGATPVLDPTDVTAADLGRAGRVAVREAEQYPGRWERREVIAFEDCPDPDAVTVWLPGAFGRLDDQAATHVRKAAGAAALARGVGGNLPGVVPGGGAVHAGVARAVRQVARGVDGREQVAATAFADAAESLVATLARNAGLDPLATVADVRAAHAAGDGAAGIVLPGGTVEDCLAAGVVDPVALVRDAYLAATDVAVQILRVDDAIDAAPVEDDGEGDVIYDRPGG